MIGRSCAAASGGMLYTPLSNVAESYLHARARAAVHASDYQSAQKFLQVAADHGESGRSHLLLVLHLQRMQRHGEDAGMVTNDMVAATFRNGIANNRDDFQLVQAWALYESKHGNMRRAVKLLQRAVSLDHSALGTLQWQRFKSYVRDTNPLARPSKRECRRVPTPSALTRMSWHLTSSDERARGRGQPRCAAPRTQHSTVTHSTVTVPSKASPAIR